jgi:hypothetical protein
MPGIRKQGSRSRNLRLEEDIDVINLTLRTPQKAHSIGLDRGPPRLLPQPGNERLAEPLKIRVVVLRERRQPTQEGVLREFGGGKAEKVGPSHALLDDAFERTLYFAEGGLVDQRGLKARDILKLLGR